MGQTTQATGTAVMSNGQSQALTSGWLSDATSIASVTSSGTVTGIANGRATIYIVSGGRQGQQLIRVTPDYHGGWDGGMRVTSCKESGAWAEAKSCEGEVGKIYGFSLSLDQTGESMNARASFGDDFEFPAVSAPIAADGTSSFKTNAQLTQDNVMLTIEFAADISSTHVGELSGTIRELWRAPNVPGELRYVEEIVQANRNRVNPSGRSATGLGASKLEILTRIR
jgi:hypothetical protein